MSQLVLYYTEHCHLCDEAEALLHTAGYGECYTKVEIENNPGLLMLYEIHIPVLKRTDNEKELFWPFGQQELTEFTGADK
jgi:predicted DCC family thiol-disulfide oxidoreductase YuxK